MRALLVANTGDDDPGYVGERLSERGYELATGYRDVPGGLPTTLDGFHLLVMLGSDWSTYWEHVRDQVERECTLVREAAGRALPVLGICYGAQLMAVALGGSVERAARTEIGWYTIDSDDDRLAPRGPWFEYHVDSFTAPARAQVLASSPAGPQAYRLDRMLGWQFHPEVSPEIIRRWGADAQAHDEQPDVDFEELYVQSEIECRTSRQRTHNLVDAFLDTVAST